MDRHSSTAAAAPSMAAAATAGPFPVARPHRMETTTIPVQITVIAIPDTSPSSPIYTGCPQETCLRSGLL